MAVERSTVTIYPLAWYWTGRVLWYLALLMAPLLLAQWLGNVAPATMQPAGRILASIVILPLLYAGLYLALRRVGARSQNFVYLLVLLFGVLVYAEGYRAWTLGGVSHWLGALFSMAYTAGFAWLAWKGSRANQREVAASYTAEREAQIDIHAEAIVRARTLEKQREDGEQGPKGAL